MNRYYFLWAFGQDRPGLVAGIARPLFLLGANLEDSSMMRLGSEFAMYVIFSVRKKISQKKVDEMVRRLQLTHRLTVGIKEIQKNQAQFKPLRGKNYMISVHGEDRPGIVFHITQILSQHKFNITDLSTHRTSSKKKAGYVAFIEGELKSDQAMKRIEKALSRVPKIKISVRSIPAESL